MKVALVGNQNCGKTTLFNSLTGMNQKIGNWPGVTVERKSGVIKDSNNELIDLPGIYSLKPYSEEEKISRDFLLNGEVDLIVNVVDCTNLERSLYLTTQLMELDICVVMALNMIDLANKKGITIDREILEKEIGIKVVEISSLKKIGLYELKEAIERENVINNKKIFNKHIEEKIDIVSRKIVGKHRRFYSVEELEKENNFDEKIANERYMFINEIKKKCVERENKKSFTDFLDKIFLNKFIALPIFFLIMLGVYCLSVSFIGGFLGNAVENFIDLVSKRLKYFFYEIGVSGWLKSLIVDGIVCGIGSVLSFVPQLMILFFCISILETSGYMSRIAFFLDMILKKFGLSGKTLVPFIVGSGCSVVGIMSTRIIDNKYERERSVVLTPFVPCSAKLPIIALFSGTFFPNKEVVVSASLYFLSILLILIVSLILRKTVYKDENSSFISELPDYKLPSIKYVLIDVKNKVLSFIKRTGTVIFISSIVIWFLVSFSIGFNYGVNIENSILAYIGKCLSWILYPILGEFSWAATVSAIQGLIAKEQVVSSMAVIANIGQKGVNSTQLFVNNGVFGFFSGASAYAYVVFNLFSAPCFGTIGAMKKELGSARKVFLAVSMQVLVAWTLGVIVNVLGTTMGRYVL